MSLTKKYLLCRPRGGLNDNLVQIEKCWRYAERFSRTLILDTEKSQGFCGNFFRFFNVLKSKCEVRTLGDDCSIKELEKYSYYPNNLQGKLAYLSKYVSGENFVDSGSGQRLTFNHLLDYDQTILVHEQCGGGSGSLDCLSRLSFTNEVCSSIAIKLAPIFTTDQYAAIHIRNTDYKTDYKRLFSRVEPRISHERVLICTDSLEAAEYAKLFFQNRKLIFTSPLIDTGRVALHEYAATRYQAASQYNAVINAVTDLIALSLSDQLFFGETKANVVSGFSKLAGSLHQNRGIVQQLFIECEGREFVEKKVRKGGHVYLDVSLGSFAKKKFGASSVVLRGLSV